MFEKLSRTLQPYKSAVGTVAGIVTVGQFLSGVFICKDVYVKGDTDGISSNPFIGGIVIGVLMLQYSLMLNDPAMLNVNLAAIVLNFIYLVFYYSYATSKSKSEVHKALAVGTILATVLLGYTKYEDKDLVEYRFGLIVTILMLALIGSPLLEAREVMVKQDSSSIPFPIVLSGSVVSFLWFLYGIILRNDFMIFQNMVGLVLCALQLALCFMYPSKLLKEKKED